ncbi:MAG: type III-A CRISPR-associated RAMP protein Csm5 [Sphaerochaeta sp.]
MSKVVTWAEYRMRLIVLTPLIINNGESYGFLELFPTQTNTAFWLNLPKVFEYLPVDKAKAFVELATEGICQQNMEKLKKARAYLVPIINLHAKDVVYRPLKMMDMAYDQLCDNPSSEFQKIMYTPLNGKPYIPGSSIKGALRTAILESERKKMETRGNAPSPLSDFNNRKHYKKSREFEAEIYNPGQRWSVENDPFKYMKVSDFFFDSKKAKTYLGKIFISGKALVNSAMTDACCLDEKAEMVTASGTISISSEAPAMMQFDSIMKSVSDFYIANYEKKHPNQNTDNGKYITDELIKYDQAKTGTVLRIGHYSGIENMTFNIEQDCELNRKAPHSMINIEGGNSHVLIEQKYSPGYCILQKI